MPHLPGHQAQEEYSAYKTDYHEDEDEVEDTSTLINVKIIYCRQSKIFRCFQFSTTPCMLKLAGRLLFYFVSVQNFLSFHTTPITISKAPARLHCFVSRW